MTMEVYVIALIVMMIGLLLMIIEATAPGGYLLIPGAVMIVIGAFGAVCSDLFYTWWTPVVAIIAVIPSTILTFWLYKRLGSPEPPSTTVTGSLVGREGVVVIAVSPNNLKGKVKIGSDTWSATADEEIPEGAAVAVDASEGVHVHVKPIQ